MYVLNRNWDGAVLRDGARKQSQVAYWGLQTSHEEYIHFPLDRLFPLCGKLDTLFFAYPSPTFSLRKLCLSNNFSLERGRGCRLAFLAALFRGLFYPSTYSAYTTKSSVITPLACHLHWTKSSLTLLMYNIGLGKCDEQINEVRTFTLPTVQMRKLTIEVISNMSKATKLVRVELWFRTSQAHSTIQAFNHRAHIFLNQDDKKWSSLIS